MLGWIIKNAMPPKIIRINGRSLTRIRASFTRPAAFIPIIFTVVRENKNKLFTKVCCRKFKG